MIDSELVRTLLTSIGGGLAAAGALAAWLGGVWKERISRTEAALVQVDIDLRLRRIEVYKELWELTALLPKWPRDKTVTYEQLLTLTHSFRDWYFHRGGMYLSRTTHRDGYTPLQDELARVLGQGKTGELSQESPDDYEVVSARCSSLRSLLAADIAARREPMAG